MVKFLFYFLSLFSFVLFLLQWSPWADAERDWKPVFEYIGFLNKVDYLTIPQHFWTSIRRFCGKPPAGTCAITRFHAKMLENLLCRIRVNIKQMCFPNELTFERWCWKPHERILF